MGVRVRVSEGELGRREPGLLLGLDVVGGVAVGEGVGSLCGLGGALRVRALAAGGAACVLRGGALLLLDVLADVPACDAARAGGARPGALGRQRV